MKRIFPILVLFLLVLLAAGCGAAAPELQSQRSMPEAPPSAADAGAIPQESANAVTVEQVQDTRKVIYTANMTLFVDDTEASANDIEQLATALGGYVTSMNGFRGADDLVFYNITLRVPVEQFEAARAALRAMAIRVDNESINTDDVTDQYFDTEAHLVTLRATEKELLALLTETRERGGKVEDIMSIYRELTNIQAQIESLQGQLNRLDKLVALSTISINLQPDELTKPITTQWRVMEVLRNSFRTLVEVMQQVLTLLINLIVVVLPTLIVLAIPVVLAVLILRWLFRRAGELALRRKSPAPKPSPTEPPVS